MTEDIKGAIRLKAFDVGAEEFNSGGLRVPYTSADVGVKVGFYGNTILGISQKKFENPNLLLCPNPVTRDYLNINYNTILVQVKIVGMQGRILIIETFDNSSGKINVSNLSTGIYVLIIQGLSKQFIR
ncbi:T9SS type A sorting domain-containing protein [Flavobacterium cellulosilyticum]|uniref:T9SS type A sorting domain-containing protein n=1 Tax=Flavobacterium cellulosilyticum TaxID=2541731 RepID=UPI001404A299|nr:T9SS type A sorting domain-containing protein [Flavobacterium cellulosilyticum]